MPWSPSWPGDPCSRPPVAIRGPSLISSSHCSNRWFSPKCGDISFENKKVVVLTQVASNSVSEYSSLDRDITREFTAILRKKAKKVTVVDPDKVMTWIEAHPKWTAPSEIANDFNADIVIFLEVEQFQIQSPGDLNMLHGESKVHIQAFEMQYPKNSKDKPIKDQPKEAVSIYDDYGETHFPDQVADPHRDRGEPVQIPDQVRQRDLSRLQGGLLALRPARRGRLDPRIREWTAECGPFADG